MKIIQKKPNALMQSHSNSNYCIIDIETTGLGHHNKIILIGLLFCGKDYMQPEFIQLFNDDGKSEKDMLQTLESLTKSHSIDYWISFNGNAFDFSFINARLVHHRFDYTYSKAPNIDLLQIARAHKTNYPLEKLNLKSIEKFYLIDREDTISGKESVELYLSYLKKPTEKEESIILLHNEDDILNLLPLYTKMLLHLGITPSPQLHLNDRIFYLDKFQLKQNHMKFNVSSFICKNLKDVIVHTMGFSLIQKTSHYECEVALLSFSSIGLYVVNTDLLFNLPFQDLSNERKQDYIVFYDMLYYTENILLILSRIIETLSIDL